MANNKIMRPGWRVSIACDAPAVPASGDPVVVGDMTGIALTDERPDGETSVDLGPAVYTIEVEETENAGIGVGDALYINLATAAVTNNPLQRFFGFALDTIPALDTATIRVSHPQSVAP